MEETGQPKLSLMHVRKTAVCSIAFLGIFSATSLLLLSIPNNSLFSFHYAPSLFIGCLLSAGALIATSFSLEAIVATPTTPSTAAASASIDKKVGDRAEILKTRLKETVSGTSTTVDDAAKVAESEVKQESLEKVKFLYDYTKFHAGLYSAIVVVLIAALTSNTSILRSDSALNRNVLFAIGLYVIAGFISGLVLSNLIHYTEIESFRSARLWVWRLKTWRYSYWVAMQYACFWIASILMVGSLL
jgi:hypothetical protein